MAIKCYLRASTKEQNASRAKEAMCGFLEKNNVKADKWYIENESGAKLDRPVLLELLAESETGDILLIEQIDRLTRLTSEDWKQLKTTIDEKGIQLVSIDLPTSHTVFNADLHDGITAAIMSAVNGMMIEMFAAFSRKDYEDRRRRQAEGIAIAKEEGKFKGKQQTQKTIDKCIKALDLVGKGLTKEQAAKAVGMGVATLYRYIKDNKETR